MSWLRKLFFRSKKRPSENVLPNAHYLGLHMAEATKKSQWYG